MECRNKRSNVDENDRSMSGSRRCAFVILTVFPISGGSQAGARAIERGGLEGKTRNVECACGGYRLPTSSAVYCLQHHEQTRGRSHRLRHGCHNWRAGFNGLGPRAVRNRSSRHRSFKPIVDPEQVALCASCSSSWSAGWKGSRKQLECSRQSFARLSGPGGKGEEYLYGACEFHAQSYGSGMLIGFVPVLQNCRGFYDDLMAEAGFGEYVTHGSSSPCSELIPNHVLQSQHAGRPGKSQRLVAAFLISRRKC